MAEDLTPDGEGSARAPRPAVRLGRKPARLGAATRLGSEVAGRACARARAPRGDAADRGARARLRRPPTSRRAPPR